MHRGLNDALAAVESACKNTLVVELLKTRSKSVPIDIELPNRVKRRAPA